MRISCITNFIHTFHNRIHRCVVANSQIRPIKIIIYRPRKSDTWHIVFLRKKHGSRKWSITSNNDQGVNLLLLHGFKSFFSPFWCCEFFWTSTFKNCSSTWYDITDTFRCEFFYFTINQSVISPINCFNTKAHAYGTPSNSSDGRIHSRWISTWC